ncbi:MAG: hypothetical protein PF517_17125 [Salinivirgaceae bacterium]|nr:hypothetical protein [Salinivirgaceae bacterium]
MNKLYLIGRVTAFKTFADEAKYFLNELHEPGLADRQDRVIPDYDSQACTVFVFIFLNAVALI